MFSTAGSFSPPVGSHIDPNGVGGGYYIDFKMKADEARWPPSWLSPRLEQLHVATAQFALGCLERGEDGEGDEWRDVATQVADYLIADQAPDGGWPHRMPMPHSYWLRPPWLSAMAQGEVASLLVRIHRLTGEERYAEAALKALEPMYLPTNAGGVRTELGGGFFPEEYPSDPASYVLNGAIFALWGCRDVAVGLGDERAAALYSEGVETLAANLHRFDTGFWSLYDLFPHPIRNVASGAYHQLHIAQLRAMQLVSPRPEFEAMATRFEGYQASRASQLRATTEKVAFRLVVPRNDLLALNLPWSHRPDHGEVLVLCYHSISNSWPSRLAVRAADFERQLALLVERGYRGVTFSDAATLAAGDRRRLAVTFDDAYASLLTEAAPILARYGIPATVFVPTSFPGGPEPMSWPGIDNWRRTPHDPELKPLNWDQLRQLADAGWEIGSHTRTHRRLTELDDERLAEELRESRTEIERRIGAPCRSIAYPYGAVDERVIAAARDAGYVTGATLPRRFDVPRLLAWPRVGVYRSESEARFRLKVSRAIRFLRSTAASPVLTRASRVTSGGGRES